MSEKFVVRLDLMGVPVPVELSLAKNATEKETAAWEMLIEHVKYGSALKASMGFTPVEPR